MRMFGFMGHFIKVFIMLEVVLEFFQRTLIQQIVFDVFGKEFCLYLLWFSPELLLFALIVGGFFRYLAKKGDIHIRILDYFELLICSFFLVLA